jgi:hypothetical protein
MSDKFHGKDRFAIGGLSPDDSYKELLIYGNGQWEEHTIWYEVYERREEIEERLKELALVGAMDDSFYFICVMKTGKISDIKPAEIVKSWKIDDSK